MASAVARGRRFEEACLSALGRLLGLRLARIGGASDRGVDLAGHWPMPGATTIEQCEQPPPPQPPQRPEAGFAHRVSVQCKSYRGKVGVAEIRELEGALGVSGSAAGIGFVCAHSGFSGEALKQSARSRAALLLVGFDGPACAAVTSLHANDELQRLVPALVVTEQPSTEQHTPTKPGNGAPRLRPAIFFNGRHIPLCPDS